MQPAGLWTALFLLALSSSALGNLLINDPLAAPRVFISFKGKKNQNLILPSLLPPASFLVCNRCWDSSNPVLV